MLIYQKSISIYGCTLVTRLGSEFDSEFDSEYGSEYDCGPGCECDTEYMTNHATEPYRNFTIVRRLIRQLRMYT